MLALINPFTPHFSLRFQRATHNQSPSSYEHFAKNSTISSSIATPSPKKIPESFMDVSVLEKQKKTLQRLYREPNNSLLHPENDQMNLHCVVDHQEMVSHCWQKVKPDHESFDATTGHAAFASCSIKKRKAAGFDVEESGEVKSEIIAKADIETSANTFSKASSKTSEAQKPHDYIHVRARRGQATDSHSLAERARREKISKKMKFLQDLVPGCNKVNGKAGMLDEIINYVQSLQKQVEFLSMKLATSNPRFDSGIDDLFANSTCFDYDHPMQQEGATSCGRSTDMALDQSQLMVPQIFPDHFLDSSCIPQIQQLPGWDFDWQNMFNVGFH